MLFVFVIFLLFFGDDFFGASSSTSFGDYDDFFGVLLFFGLMLL